MSSKNPKLYVCLLTMQCFSVSFYKNDNILKKTGYTTYTFYLGREGVRSEVRKSGGKEDSLFSTPLCAKAFQRPHHIPNTRRERIYLFIYLFFPFGHRLEVFAQHIKGNPWQKRFN